MEAKRKPSATLARAVLTAAIGLLSLFLALPLIAVFLRVSPVALWSRVRDPVVLEALRLSLVTSLISTAVIVVLGLPLAWWLATRSSRASRWLEALVSMPLVLPPTVAGIGLLMAFGPGGFLGGALSALGFATPVTTVAVVLAQVFVATPFFVATVVTGFREVDARYLDAAATLRAAPATVFSRIMLPLAMPSVLAGAVVCWARALGEFGATVTFAGSVPGVTRTLPLAVYAALQSDPEVAIVVSVLLLVVSIVLLAAFRALPLRLVIGGSRAPRSAG